MSELSTFTQTLESALTHYQEATWLGEQSPLASPYFLGERLQTFKADGTGRGRALQALLQEATAQITGKYSDRYQTILREYYFANRPVNVVSDQVGLGKNSFHLSRNAAIAALANEVIRLVHPTLRLEKPPRVEHLWEREAVQQRLEQALLAGETVLLGGTAGLGKTALASRVAQRSTQPVFWYTIHRGLTDQLGHLLFALGYFLQKLGAPALWLELVATPGQVDGEKLLGLTRHALAQLHPVRPLLCIDEVYVLHPADNPGHGPLLAFLNALRGLAPLLLIGHQPTLIADQYITLTGLSLAALRDWLHTRQLVCSFAELTELHRYTQGNPALVQLAMALLSSGLPLTDLIEQAASTPALEALLSRMLRQLTAPVRSGLMELTVYRTPAPQELWQSEERLGQFRQLLAIGLVQSDERGGLLVAPIYRLLLYQLLPAQQRQTLHQRAAQEYQARGMITPAVDQWIQADQVEAAIWLWRDHQQAEIEQGQARTALDLLRGLQSRALSAPAREALTLALATLERFTGDLHQALQEIHAIFWHTPLLTVEADELTGAIANDQSNFPAAERAFQSVLQRTSALLEVRRSQAYKGLAWLHLRQRELDQAETEAFRAQYEAANIRGNIQLARYQYAQAIEQYQQALTLAQEINYQEGVAKTYINLAHLHSIQGQHHLAQTQIQQALAIFKRLSSPVDEIGTRLTLAVAYTQAGDQKQAISILSNAQERLDDLVEPPIWLQALLRQAQAEAHLGLGELEMARAAVQAVIAAEEIDLLPDAYRTYGEILGRGGEVAAAESYLQQAIALAHTNEDAYLGGYGWRALGVFYWSQGRAGEAAAAWQQASELFTAIALPNEVAKTLDLLGKLPTHGG